MSTTGAVPTITSVLVEDFPESVDEDFLSEYFRSRVDPSLCQVVFVRTPIGERTRIHAIVDLGSYGKVQQAIREVNGKDIEGKNISVSAFVPSFKPLPGTKVYLKNIPAGTGNAVVHDLVNEYGTIVSIERTSHQSTDKQSHSACITFLREEDAQRAIRMINASRRDDSVVAECDRDFSSPGITPSQCTETGDANAADEEKRRMAKEHLFDLYKEDIKPQGQFEKILDVLERSLEAEHMLEHCVQKNRFHLYAEMVDEMVLSGDRNITQLSTEALEVAEWMELTGKPMDEKLRIIRERLHSRGLARYQFDDYDVVIDKIMTALDISALLELFVNEDRFRLVVFQARMVLMDDGELNVPSLSNAACDLVLQLGLDKLESVDEWTQVMRDYLVDKHRDRYGEDQLTVMLHIVFRCLSNPPQVHGLLNICAADTHRFAAYAMVAKFAIDTRIAFSYSDIPDSVVSVIRELDLAKLESPDEWKQAMRDHLADLHRGQYDDIQLSKMLNALLVSLSSPSQFYDLLRTCIVDADRFAVYAAAAQISVATEYSFTYRDIPDSVVMIVRELDLAKLESPDEWKKAMRGHLAVVHCDRYGKEQLENLLSTMFRSWVRPSEFYDLLTICVDERLFSVYATVAQISIDTEDRFPHQDLPDSVVSMVHQLDLSKLNSRDGFKEAILEHLVVKHRNLYSETYLGGTLDGLFDTLVEAVEFYDLLAVCAADTHCFAVYRVIAQISDDTGDSFAYSEIPDSIASMVRQLDLSKLDSMDGFKDAILEHLVVAHRDRYNEEQLASMLDPLFENLTEAWEFYELLEICSDMDILEQYYEE